MILDDTGLGIFLTNRLCRGVGQTMVLQQGVDQYVCLHFLVFNLDLFLSLRLIQAVYKFNNLMKKSVK